jgi:hypothetical protein
MMVKECREKVLLGRGPGVSFNNESLFLEREALSCSIMPFIIIVCIDFNDFIGKFKFHYED